MTLLKWASGLAAARAPLAAGNAPKSRQASAAEYDLNCRMV
jgi:hypothetical protein